MKENYEKIGLKCGIEIHQQIDTEKKLFCKCISRLSPSETESEITRKLRVVAGETGEIDAAAMGEFLRNRKFVYKTYPDETCLVETDEEPPHEINKNALDITLTVAELLKCTIPEEIHVMRKIVLDGSNTSGFQRTAIAGLDGNLKTSFGNVGITNICVEEESAQIIKREGNRTIYGLDRLGIPLVEIGTTADIHHPQQAKEVAQKLGMFVRSTGKVKRGLGTIRQDVNVSIKNGARVEIKGVQDLKMIPKYVENEIERQKNLLVIRNKLKKMNFRKVKPEIVHVSHIFKGSSSNITRNKATYAIFIPNFAGFLKRKITPTRTLGNEIASYIRAKSELKGIIHSDEELEKYKLSKEFNSLRNHIKAKKGDTLIIAVGEKDKVEVTMKAACDRVNQLLDGVPKEVRRARENGDSDYLRPLPGAARLYPETDVPPIQITKERLKRIKSSLPELISDREKRMTKELTGKLDISDELIKQIIKSGRKELLDKLLKEGFDAKIVSNTLTSTLTYLKKKEKINTSKLSNSHFIEVFSALKKGQLSKEAIPEVLKAFIKNPKADISKITENLGIKGMSDSELSKIVRGVIAKNKNLLKDSRGEKILMGLVMKEVRGKVDAGKVVKAIKKEMS